MISFFDLFTSPQPKIIQFYTKFALKNVPLHASTTEGTTLFHYALSISH